MVSSSGICSETAGLCIGLSCSLLLHCTATFQDVELKVRSAYIHDNCELKKCLMLL